MSSADVELRLFGSPSLSRQGQQVQLHSSKTLALLAYLVLEAERDHARAELAELLWRGAESPRHGLRQAVYSLRNALGVVGETYLVADRETLRFEPDDRLHVDATALRAAAKSQSLEQLADAASHYKGPLLVGYDLPDQPQFEQWLTVQRRWFLETYAKILTRLAEGHLRLHQLDEAEEWTQRILDANPLQEHAHRLLMRVHAANGDSAELEAQYLRCVRVIQEELGSEVSPRTRNLYQQLAGAARSSSASLSEPASTLPESDWLDHLPLVARQQEMEHLDRLLSKARQGRTQLAWVEAESGMGKTRLLDEFIHTSLTLRDPPRILAASCHEHEFAAPYTLWADALRPLSDSSWKPHWQGLPTVWRREMARLLPGLSEQSAPLPGLSPDESQLRLHQATARTLIHLAESGPVVLALDDLHWIDEASLALLHYIVRHVKRAQLMIIGTHRPEISTENLPWERFIKDPDRPGTQLTLQPFSTGDIRDLLTKLPAAFEGELPKVLQRHSDGIPLVLLETLRAMMHSGHLTSDGSQFRANTSGENLPLPNAVHELIEHRLSSLSDDARRALECAAAIGRPFSVRLLAGVTGLTEPFMLDVCAALERRGLFKSELKARSDRSLGFAHSYIRRAVYEHLGTARRQSIHTRIAENLSRTDPLPAEDLDEIAFHFERAQDPRALNVLLDAGQRALDIYAFEHCARRCRRGLELADEISYDDPGIRYKLLTLLETALDRTGRRQEQRAVIDRLLELTEREADLHQHAEALLRKASLLTYLGQHLEARSAGMEAVGILRRLQDRAGEAQALRELAFDHWGAQDFTTALDYCREVLDIHRTLNQVNGQASALHNLAEIHRELGSPRRALDLFQQAIELYWSTQDLEGQGLAYYGMGHAKRSLGELEAAIEAYENALDALRKAGNRLMSSRVHHTLSGLHQQQGELDAALEEAQRALEISRGIGYGPGIAHGLTALARLELGKDRRQAAVDSLTEAIEWLELLENEQATTQARALLQDLTHGGSTVHLSWPEPGWIRSHVPLEEGKVYCAFESPLARAAAG